LTDHVRVDPAPAEDEASPTAVRLHTAASCVRVVDHGGVIRRHELTDQEWELPAPLIPRAATGRPRVSDRRVINGMVYQIRTGISWRDLPERYGPCQTVYTRFGRYALDGVFTRALQQIRACADAAGDIDWLVQIGSTIVHAHSTPPPPAEKGGHQPAPSKWTVAGSTSSVPCSRGSAPYARI
jgi:transposase